MNNKTRRLNVRSSFFFKAGIPLLSFLLGGSYILSQFMQTHLEIKDKHSQSKSKRKFDLEEEHRMLMKKLDIENFSLSRIPRPETLEGSKIGKKSPSITTGSKWINSYDMFNVNRSLRVTESQLEFRSNLKWSRRMWEVTWYFTFSDFMTASLIGSEYRDALFNNIVLYRILQSEWSSGACSGRGYTQSQPTEGHYQKNCQCSGFNWTTFRR